MFSACLSVQTALVGNVVNDVRLWGLNFSGNVYMHRRLAFSMPHSSSYFQIVSIRLLSFGKLKKKKEKKETNKLKRVDEIEFESNWLCSV